MYEKILQLDLGIFCKDWVGKDCLEESKFSTACTVMIADDDDDDASGSEFGHARGSAEALEVLGDALAGSKNYPRALRAFDEAASLNMSSSGSRAVSAKSTG